MLLLGPRVERLREGSMSLPQHNWAFEIWGKDGLSLPFLEGAQMVPGSLPYP